MHVSVLQEPRPLEHGDDRARFQSGNDEIDDWFHRYAWQNQQAGNARVFVTVQEPRTVGSYALAMGSVERGRLPAQLKPQRRPDPYPCLLFARLAVDRRAQGRGIGAALLKDALLRAYVLSREFGFAALLVHCADQQARDFYLSQSSQFVPCPGADNHLMLPLGAIKRYVEHV